MAKSVKGAVNVRKKKRGGRWNPRVTAVRHETRISKEKFTTACVRLGDQQVLVHVSEAGVPLRKFALRIKDGKKPRRLTRDEELALAAAPGTAAERASRSSRAGDARMSGGFAAVLEPRPFLAGEQEQVVAQLEWNARPGGGGANTDDMRSEGG